MRVIINADDLGASEIVNDAVFRLMDEKRLTSATLMANGPCIEEAVKKMSLFPACSFGIHLNISEHRPLTKQKALQVLLDENGCFRKDDSIRKIKINASLLQAVFDEFSAQVENLISFGVVISHIDSHQHVHTIPEIFYVLKKLQKKYGIRKARISRNIYTGDMEIPYSLSVRKKLYNFMLRKYYGTETTSGFTDFLTFCENCKVKGIKHESVELMVHPGLKDYEKETALLYTDWQNDLPYAVKLINYNEL